MAGVEESLGRHGGVMNVDLARNTVDGRRLPPSVVELAFVLADGRPRSTADVIARLYGVIEPGDAANALKQRALMARRHGLPIHGSCGGIRGSGAYRLG